MDELIEARKTTLKVAATAVLCTFVGVGLVFLSQVVTSPALGILGFTIVVLCVTVGGVAVLTGMFVGMRIMLLEYRKDRANDRWP